MSPQKKTTWSHLFDIFRPHQLIFDWHVDVNLLYFISQKNWKSMILGKQEVYYVIGGSLLVGLNMSGNETIVWFFNQSNTSHNFSQLWTFSVKCLFICEDSCVENASYIKKIYFSLEFARLSSPGTTNLLTSLRSCLRPCKFFKFQIVTFLIIS